MESITEPTLFVAKLSGWPIIGVTTFLINVLGFSNILSRLALINCSPIFLGILSATILLASAIRCLYPSLSVSSILNASVTRLSITRYSSEVNKFSTPPFFSTSLIQALIIGSLIREFEILS